MSSLYPEKPTKSRPKGRWILEYNIYIDGEAKRPVPRIKKTKKSDIPNKVRIAAQDLEVATKTGTASNAAIDQWILTGRWKSIQMSGWQTRSAVLIPTIVPTK